jgi:hypothetical protein
VKKTLTINIKAAGTQNHIRPERRRNNTSPSQKVLLDQKGYNQPDGAKRNPAPADNPVGTHLDVVDVFTVFHCIQLEFD